MFAPTFNTKIVKYKYFKKLLWRKLPFNQKKSI